MYEIIRYNVNNGDVYNVFGQNPNKTEAYAIADDLNRMVKAAAHAVGCAIVSLYTVRTKI